MAINRKISLWLAICAFCVILMIVVGGLTRLTGSGLSIADWRPVTGIIPPLNEKDWAVEFGKYLHTPEFKKVNFAFNMDQFKSIFWLEYYHRLLGRIIGFIFLIPCAVFLYKKYISKIEVLKFTSIFALGGLQGAFGWIMVKSGLVDVPHVSHYLLALHLSTAFILLGLLTFCAVRYYYKDAVYIQNDYNYLSSILIVICLIQVIYGAFVAGLRAGLIYNNFPLMGAGFIPVEFQDFKLIKLFADPAIVQFIHRIMAFILVFAVIFISFVFSKKHHNSAKITNCFNYIMILLVVQITLGILTLLHYVPTYLASIHQFVASILFVSIIVMHFHARYKVN